MVDFELLDTQRHRSSRFDELARYITNRRKQLQDWEARPPHALGFFILMMVSIEMVLGKRLMAERGLQSGFWGEVFGIALGLAVIEFVISKIVHELGTFFQKKGKPSTAFTFLNLGLLPFLLLLPLTLVTWFRGGFEAALAFLTILLALQVMANWREALEVSYELTKLQSGVIIFICWFLFVSVSFLIFYLSLFKSLISFI